MLGWRMQSRTVLKSVIRSVFLIVPTTQSLIVIVSLSHWILPPFALRWRMQLRTVLKSVIKSVLDPATMIQHIIAMMLQRILLTTAVIVMKRVLKSVFLDASLLRHHLLLDPLRY